MNLPWLLFSSLRTRQDTVKHLPYSLLVAAPVLLLTAPAQAAGVQSWRFDTNQNQLEFTTNQDVQPRAQLIADPTRLVIDLPGIILGRPSFTESIGNGTIRSVRFGQFDRQTTRMVVEFAPGYTIDPEQVKFRGLTARQWTVQLPTPQLLPPEAIAPSDPSATVVPTTPSPIVSGPSPISPPTTSPPLFALATVEAIALENNQLLIRANQGIRYTTGWDRSTGAYRITINSAQLASTVREPRLDASSPLLRLRLQQADPRTVIILATPARGIQIRDTSQPGQQFLALQLQRVMTPPAAPPAEPVTTIPVPAPPRTPFPLPPPPTSSDPEVPRVPNGRVVVVVDPGHGGPDPGAIGRGGIQEKEIVLDIGRQVAALLEKQGVQAILTRSSDIDLDLEPRVQLAERANASVFVSIHANAIDLNRPDINGLETYYYNNGEELARTIHRSVLEGTGVADRRVRSARFYVLRKTSMPAVLVETGFVTGRDDAARLANPNYRSQMAAAIVRGILQYIQRSARF